MPTPGRWKVYRANCKDCGVPYTFSETALKTDIARGLSAPERCPACRKINSRVINSKGVGYWKAPLELDPSKRRWDKLGLGRLKRERGKVEEIHAH